MTSPPPPVLDPTTPHAADDLDAHATGESHPLVWRGLALGLALAALGWILLAAVGLTLYALFAQ